MHWNCLIILLGHIVLTYISYKGRKKDADDLEMRIKASNFVENGRKMFRTTHMTVLTSNFG